MGFMVGLFLTYMEEREAFYMMVAVIEKYKLQGFFTDGMPLISKAFFSHSALLAEHLPKLYKHFTSLNVDASMYASKWFMTNYCSAFPFEVIVRIWDCFLHEGVHIVYRVSVAVFKLLQEELLQAGFEGVFKILKKFSNEVDPDALIKAAYSIKISQKRLDEINAYYNEASASKDLEA